MSARPLVSVIIPVHNTPRALLAEAIDSALGQSHGAVEVIVVDDGSATDTRWVEAAYRGRLAYVAKGNGGPASARNEGIRRAAGEYVAFLDADDVWEPDKLARQLQALQAHPAAGLAYARVTRIDEHGRSAPGGGSRTPGAAGRIAAPLFRQNFIPTSTVVVRRRCFEAVGLFDEAPELISVEDYDLWLRIAERFEAVYVDAPLTRYRVHRSGISKRIDRSYAGERLVLEKAIARRGGPEVYPRRALAERFAQLHFEWGYDHFAQGSFRQARAQFLKSLAFAPWRLLTWAYYIATGTGYHFPAGLAGKMVPGTNLPPLRLMHVLFSLETGGAEHVVLNLMRRMDPARYELHVCSLSGEGPLAAEFRRLGVRVHPLTKARGIDLGLCLRLARLMRRERIAVVHTHNATPWLYAGIAAKLSGAELIHTEHSNLFPHQRALRRAERWLAGRTRVVIADSEKVRRQLVDQQSLPASKVVTIVNGIDTAAFAGQADTARKRAALQLNGAGPIIGTVGRLVPVKDQQTLLEAFRPVAAAYPHALLLLVGDGPMRRPLEACAQALGLGDRVRFLGDRGDVAELLALVDVFALSSVSEGMPLTILEAMAAGRPVVATDVGGVREAVIHGQTGLLVPARSSKQFAEALLALLGDRAGRERMGQAARARAREQFNLERMVDGYEAAYHH